MNKSNEAINKVLEIVKSDIRTGGREILAFKGKVATVAEAYLAGGLVEKDWADFAKAASDSFRNSDGKVPAQIRTMLSRTREKLGFKAAAVEKKSVIIRISEGMEAADIAAKLQLACETTGIGFADLSSAIEGMIEEK
jgi:hypothetical protein